MYTAEEAVANRTAAFVYQALLFRTSASHYSLIKKYDKTQRSL